METSAILPLYCKSLTHYKRRVSSVVNVGDVPLGGGYPIRVQSMTTTDTMDTQATVEQSVRMIEAGCDYVRITAPSIKEAENLKNIKNELRRRGYKTPLVADIHFTPNAAEAAARIVEKVRINPGNYADKKRFEHVDYSDEGYRAELDKIRQRFTPLLKICKEYGTAMRIGVNHGSLSDRIMSRYGDTPRGMVESAMEFLRICGDNDFSSIVLSMKSSNPQVMVQAYRLLVQTMNAEGMNFPLHLGVTEAGEGEDGRIKSAAGIGALLEDGLGDTIRVSLTEDPEFEVPVAKILANRYNHYQSTPLRQQLELKPDSLLPYSPYNYSKRETDAVHNMGGKNVPVIIADAGPLDAFPNAKSLFSGLWKNADRIPDYFFVGDYPLMGEPLRNRLNIPKKTGIIYNYGTWKNEEDANIYPYFSSLQQYVSALDSGTVTSPVLNFVALSTEDIKDYAGALSKYYHNMVWVLESEREHSLADERRICIELMKLKNSAPVIIRCKYPAAKSEEEILLYAATDAAGLLIDGMGDGLWISAPLPPAILNSIGFGILQAARQRISKTEYISCPSCGRTLFNLQEVSERIHERTSHLKGLKIGIMGCIVNGPGEMADADYGYVGTGMGKITLYKGKQVVQRNIPSAEAVDALINLIKENGDWVQKE